MSDCVHYYYDSGYSCKIRKIQTDGCDSSIDHDTARKYCWSCPDDCPILKKYNEDSSGWCFLTSACTEAKGLPDDCRELTTLRSFRDTYMKALPEGEKEIRKYYEIAPKIVAAIRLNDNSLQVFEDIYNELVMPCVKLIDDCKFSEAYEHYRGYTLRLQGKYLS